MVRRAPGPPSRRSSAFACMPTKPDRDLGPVGTESVATAPREAAAFLVVSFCPNKRNKGLGGGGGGPPVGEKTI